MFKTGDLVFHPHRGAGIITGIQSRKVIGADEPYYTVTLATGETMLLPVRAEQSEVLTPFTAPQAIVDVLGLPPSDLHPDYRQRTLDMETKLSSGDPLQVAEALRDLAWRQHKTRLSGGDLRLMSKAHKMLANALVVKPNMDVRAAAQLLDAMLKNTINTWKAAG